MKKNKLYWKVGILCVLIIIACVLFFLIMRQNGDKPSSSQDQKIHNVTEETENTEESQKLHSYLSITYTDEDPSTPRGRMMKFYTYDLDERKLEYVADSPFESQYALGCVDKNNRKIYLSAQGTEEDESSDYLYEYDIETGKRTELDHTNRAYNDIIKVGDYLLVTTVPIHSIGTGKFDLKTKTFDYLYSMQENSYGRIDFKYTTRPVPLNYNPVYHNFCNVSAIEDELYSVEFRSFEKSIDYYIELVDENLNVIGKCTFDLLPQSEVDAVAQISENHALMKESYEKDIDSDTEYRYYDIDFEKGTYQRVDCPFAEMKYVYSFITFDEGNSYYIDGEDKSGKSGLFYYDCNNNDHPLILENGDNSHVVNFCCVEQ